MGRLIRAFKAFFTTLFSEQTSTQPSCSSKSGPSTCKKEKEPQEATKEHLRLLALLQQQSRFIDFLQEDLNGCTDEQIGAVARQIHQACREQIEELVTIRPLLTETEGSTIHIPEGYDPTLFKLTGNVKGSAPYKGIVRHAGWKAHKLSLPKQTGEYNREIIAPAEIEI